MALDNFVVRLKNLFEQKQVIFTDYFNVAKVPPNSIKGFENINVVTYNPLDKLIFSQWFNISNSNISSTVQENTVLVNPPTIQSNAAIIFTEPRTGISAQVLAYPLNKLKIFTNDNRTNTHQQQPIILLNTVDMWSPPCTNSVCKLFDKHPNFAAISQFRIVLQILAQGDVVITLNLYESIKGIISNYIQFRNLTISGNGKIVNANIRRPIAYCRSTRSGIQP